MKAIFSFCTLFLTMTLLLAGSCKADGDTNSKEPLVKLQLAVEVNQTGTTLVCILTNTSERDVLTLPPGNTLSYLVAKNPQGEVRKWIGPIDFLDVSALKPSESLFWKTDISQKIGWPQVVEPGLHQFHWEWREFTYRESDAGAFYRSNDILLFRAPKAK